MTAENTRIVTRIRDKSRGYSIWNINEIFFNTEKDKRTAGLVVPNIGDLVHEYKGDILVEYVVVGVEEETDVPKLKTVHRINTEKKENVFLNGIGNGHLSELHRIFFDPHVTPHTLMMDAGLHYYGEQGAYVKLFRPDEAIGLGLCISQYRTNNGENVSENVPLVTLGNRFDDSTAIKRPVVFHTTEELKVGDVVIAVVYTAEGHESRRDNLIVAHGANVRELNASTSYVSSVEIESPFLSASDDRLLEFPAHVAKDALFTRARITYSDGRIQRLPIDGDRLSIIGLENYVGTLRGELNSFGLKYKLGNSELAYNASSGETRHITTMYRYRTGNIDGDYSVHINVIPRWVDDATGWVVKYYLTNLDRTISTDVTDLVEFTPNSAVFNGKSFGKVQHIVVALDLSKLGTGLKPYRHVQGYEISLSGSPLNYDKPYLIHYHVGQPEPYGEFSRVNMTRTAEDYVAKVNLNSWIEAPDLETFLKRTYYAMKPLYDNQRETNAPKPTHFIVTSPSGSKQTHLISQWDKAFDIEGSILNPIKEGDTLEVRWVAKIGPVQVLNLATTPFTLRYN